MYAAFSHTSKGDRKPFQSVDFDTWLGQTRSKILTRSYECYLVDLKLFFFNLHNKLLKNMVFFH